MPPRITRDETGIVTFDRETFFTEVFDWQEGEAVTALCPFGGGKTQLMLRALEEAAKPEIPATLFVMKPRDATIERFITRNRRDTRVVQDWPPKASGALARLVVKLPRFWVLWPSESGDPDYDDLRQAVIFRRAIRSMYTAAGRKGKRHKPSIIFADETYSLEHELKLQKDLNRIWSKGRSVGCAMWAASQRPVWISRWALQAQHLFLGNDPDVDMQKRYGEIGGGINPDAVKACLATLKRYQFLYINRDERSMCIVDAN